MLPDQPAVTVLMPAYNAGKYIAEAIDSILQQTFTNFEFLIIDDGSTDDTLSIVQRYRDARIRLVSRPNKGLIASLNEGLQLAAAPLVARFDADDVCLPERLSVQLQFLQEHPDYVLVAADVIYMDEAGLPLTRINPAGYTYEEIKANIYRKCPFLHPTVTFRKEAVLEAGGYPPNAVTFEDHLLWTKLLSKGKMCNLNRVLLHVRLNPASVTIDERWRGKEFIELRLRSLQNGYVGEQDAIRLREIIASQNTPGYKLASYHAMIGKKYLWDNPKPGRARAHLAQAIRAYPQSAEPYFLWLMSFLPSVWVRSFYKFAKSRRSI